MSFDVGTRNLGIAVARVDDDGGGGAEILRLETVDIKASTTDRICVKLWDHLDSVVADSVTPHDRISALVEQQPSKAHSVMRSVELAIRHYFLMLGRTRARVTVKSVSPRKKLASAVAYPQGSTPSQQYRARKKAGVAEILGLLDIGAPAAAAALRSGKADDAADAALYIVRHGCVTSFRDRHSHRGTVADDVETNTHDAMQDAVEGKDGAAESTASALGGSSPGSHVGASGDETSDEVDALIRGVAAGLSGRVRHR